MKLLIQIPCFDEAEGLPLTLAELPRTVAGFDAVEYLVIDDGSTDGTEQIAWRHGAHHVVRHPHNRGFAAAFMTGIAACLALGADAIVTTDGDNQYDGRDIPALVAPLRNGQVDYVLGVRPLGDRRFFPLWKSLLTRLGTRVARLLSGVPTQDAPSGMRAYSAATARRLRVQEHYSYTMETLVLSGSLGLRMASVPIRVHAVVRPSRLMRSVPEYIRKSTIALLRAVALYRPRMAWGLLAAISAIPMGVASGWNAIRGGSIGWPLLPVGIGLALFIAGSGAIWRWRRHATNALRARDTVPAMTSAALVRADAHRGDHLATADGDQEEPLPGPGPGAGIDVAFAAASSQHGAGG